MSNSFQSAIRPPDGFSGTAYWFIYRNGELLVTQTESGNNIPRLTDPASAGVHIVRRQYVGALGPHHCFAAEMVDGDAAPDGMEFFNLRQLFGRIEDELFGVAMRTVQIVAWDRDNQYCGRCATPMEPKSFERAKHCPGCGLTRYPRISPAIIVAVVKDGNQLMMARGHRYPPGWYSVLAGFVEPGETLEEAVAREVKEEVGIDVTSIRYFGSQPWPFPDSLMVAFTAEYNGGAIVLEEAEIADARWFSLEEIPKRIPSNMSISRRLIDWFVETQQA